MNVLRGVAIRDWTGCDAESGLKEILNKTAAWICIHGGVSLYILVSRKAFKIACMKIVYKKVCIFSKNLQTYEQSQCLNWVVYSVYILINAPALLTSSPSSCLYSKVCLICIFKLVSSAGK